MILRYILSALTCVIATLLAFIFADLIALFIRSDGTLPWLLKWAATADNKAIGDKDFNENQMPTVSNKTWLGRYRLARAWTRRNPAYFCDFFFGITYKEGFEYTEEGQTDANIGRHHDGTVYGVAGSYSRHLINGDGKHYFERCWVWNSGKIWNRIQLGWHLHTPAVGQRRHLKLTTNRW